MIETRAQILETQVIRPVLRVVANMWGSVAKTYQSRRLILCYHSLTGGSGEYKDRGYVKRRWRLSVNRLERQLRWLSEWASFSSLDSLFEDLGSGWRVAITFDDGYVDNLNLGLPLFEKYEVPVTWFVCPYFVERPSRLPWWDLIDYVEYAVDDVISFSCAEESFNYALKQEEEKERFRQEQRQRYIRESIEERSARCEAITEAVVDCISVPRNGFATKAEVARAAQSPWITVEAHTKTHQNLAACTHELLESEVKEGQRILEEWTGQPVRWFCYPFGGPSYWNEEVATVVRDAGFRGSVTLVSDYVEKAPHPFAIPRMAVSPSWSLADFRSRVLGSDVFRVARRLNSSLRI